MTALIATSTSRSGRRVSRWSRHAVARRRAANGAAWRNGVAWCAVAGLAPFGAAPAPVPPQPAPPPTVAVPVDLPPVELQCLQGSWSVPLASLSTIVVSVAPTANVVSGSSVLNVSGTTFTWESSYTVETIGVAPPASMPMPDVVSQADVWWLQSGDVVLDTAMVAFVPSAQSGDVVATRAFLDGAWMAFPGGGQPPIPTLLAASAACSPERLELFVPVADAPGAARVVTLDRHAGR